MSPSARRPESEAARDDFVAALETALGDACGCRGEGAGAPGAETTRNTTRRGERPGLRSDARVGDSRRPVHLSAYPAQPAASAAGLVPHGSPRPARAIAPRRSAPPRLDSRRSAPPGAYRPRPSPGSAARVRPASARTPRPLRPRKRSPVVQPPGGHFASLPERHERPGVRDGHRRALARRASDPLRGAVGDALASANEPDLVRAELRTAGRY
jgi:hypothetical protein